MMAHKSKQGDDPSVTQVLKELAGSISKALDGAADLSTEVPGLTLYRNTAPTAPNPCTYEPSLLLVPQGKKRVDLGKQSYVFGESTSSSHQSNFRSSAEYPSPVWRSPTWPSFSSLIWASSATFSTPRRCGFLHRPLEHAA